MVVVEAYPQLKANEQFNQLMSDVKVTEDRVNIARTDYNSLVRSYNILTSTFPKRVLANMWGYEQMDFFENKEGSSDAPKITM